MPVAPDLVFVLMRDDLDQREMVDTRLLEWVHSPRDGVCRKRVFHRGSEESGQVTSLVRYNPGTAFPEHHHPGGEEILVLEGTFSDQTGDWKTGSLLLNPEGFVHSPHSVPGCLLFVRLKQYAGEGRETLALDSGAVDWQPTNLTGIEVKPLYAQQAFADTLRMERWAPGVQPGRLEYPLGVEIFVLSGSFADEGGKLVAGCWLRLPVGSSHCPVSPEGCELYIREAGLPALVDADFPKTAGGVSGSPNE